jgi:dethiobiotin synthetase
VRVLFVTGTDTGVGKTVVTAALAAMQLSLGRRVAVVKPAQTGVEPGADGDLEEVRRLAGAVSLHEGVRLAAPLAPDTAARLAGSDLPSLDQQRNLVDRVAREHDLTLVEGSGGVLVGLGEHWNLLDLAECVRHAGHEVGFVVVARAGLGTLNHSGLTVHAIQERELYVEGVVVGSWPAQPGLAENQNLLDLPLLTGVPVLGRIPAGAATLPVRQFRRDALEWLPVL